MDRLVKAKSDGSLASTTTTATVNDASLNKMKSRSLEPLTGLAMWSSEPQIIELVKGERGLGFSILDYQVSTLQYSVITQKTGREWCHFDEGYLPRRRVTQYELKCQSMLISMTRI